MSQQAAQSSENSRRKNSPKMTLAELWSTEHTKQERSKTEIISKIIPFILAGQVPVDLYKNHDREIQCFVEQRQSLVVKDGILYREFLCANGTVSR
jgi:hypothetical protein